MTALPNPPAPNRTDTDSPAAAWLGRLRALARAMLVTQRLGWVLAWTLAVLLVAGAADYVLRTPTAFRVVLWLAGAGLLIGLLRRVVWPAVRFNPALTEVALRIESSAAGRAAGLPGVLASGLELAHQPAQARLAGPVIAEARSRLGTLSAARLLAPTRTARSLIWLLAAAGSIAVVAGMEPNLTRIGARRILWPVGNTQWPKRTGVSDITGVKVHPLGSALALRAAVTLGRAGAASARVAANFRTISGAGPSGEGGGVAGPLRRVLLTSQDRMVRVDPAQGGTLDSDKPNAGYLFERLLEPSGLGAESAGVKGRARADRPGEMTLEYWFETEDDRTEPARVLLVDPPAVVRASATVNLPPYAGGLLDRFPELAKGNGTIDLGAGSDERAAAPAVLAGSRMALRIELSKPVPGPVLDRRAEWAKEVLGNEAAALLAAEGPNATLDTAGAAWTLTWTITDPLRLSVKPVDEHGIAGVEEASYRFDALKDNPPSVVMTAPMEDKAVLATASIDLAAEARDDVGLSWLSLERQTARKPKGSEGAPSEPDGDPVEFGKVQPGTADVAPGAPAQDTRRLVTREKLELVDLDLKAGDEVWITAAATDAYDLNGARHGVVRSGVRKLRIMSREELVQAIWTELGSVRRTAMKIDEDQREVSKAGARKGPDEARRAERAQTGITERVARQAEDLGRIGERVAENGLSDQSLGDVLKRSKEMLGAAGEKSVEASASLNKAEKAESQESPAQDAGKKDREEAAAAQSQVRDELGKLIDMLDQGEDTYAAKRSLEQALAEQKALRDRTQQAGQSTTGKSAEQLSPQQKQELQQVAQDQQAAAQKMREAIDKMLEREQKLQKNDAAAAQQMAQAAKRGQKEQVAEKMQQAAQQVQQNQTNSAQQRQSQAIASMEQMLKELDKTNQARDEVLRRYLASLMDSLKALIQQQEDRLGELERAVPERAFAGLDAGMARLHQATLGVLDEAKGAPREAADALGLIDRAADAMAAAVVGLRDAPVNDDEVRGQEQLSLDKLKEALAIAEKIDEAAEERDQDRKRAGLRGRYEEALKSQTGIRESSIGLVGAEPSRRTKANARQLGEDQEALRTTVEAMRAEVKELREAKVFDYAHTRMDGLMAGAAAALGTGEVTQDVTRRQTGAARVLASLIDALDDRKKDDKKFREREQEQQGGGGGGGQQPLVPPAAEIKLLRSMQQEAAERTRDLGDGRAVDGMTVEEAASLQRDIADQAKALMDRLRKKSKPGDEPRKVEPETVPSPDEPKDPDAKPEETPEKNP